MEGVLSPETRMHKDLLEVWASQRPVHVWWLCSWGWWQDSQRIPVQPLGTTLGCLVCSSLCIRPSCSGNTTAPAGPKTLESKAKAKQPQEWWEVRLTISHTHGLSKVDLCVRPRHQEGSEESHRERVPHVALLRPWPQVAAGA